jgi:type IV secretion system protein VirB4
VARLDLGGMPDIRVALSGRESSVRRLDELRARFGNHPSQWWPHLIGTPWPGPAADDDAPPPRLRAAAP